MGVSAQHPLTPPASASFDFWPKSVTRIIKNGRHPKEDAVYEG